MAIMGNINGRYNNIELLVETDFNITPANVNIYEDVFPYSEGDIFPDEFTLHRANVYKTNTEIYKNNFEKIMDNVLSWNDFWQNPVTKMANTAIIANLPDFNSITESWVELITAVPPKISSNVNDSNDPAYNSMDGIVRDVSNMLDNINFNNQVQDIIRSAYCLYGNKVVRVSKLEGGNVNIVNMPVKNWIPWVNKNDTSVIDVNIFFSIYNEDGVWYCQFMSYHEDGKIEKHTFYYNNGVLGAQVGDVETAQAFGGIGVSPIVVFTSDNIGGGIFGESQYKNWDASISFTIRAFETLGVLMEQLKEIYRVLPDGVTSTDEDTGITFHMNTGTIAYKGEEAPSVKIEKAIVQVNDALEIYKTGVKRVAHDTGLPLSYFDETNLGSKVSGEALRATMFRSSQKASKIMEMFRLDIKRLIVKIGLATGVELDLNDIGIKFDTGFVSDKALQNKIIQSRVGSLPTMTLEDAIKEYDNLSNVQAKLKADELRGILAEIKNDDDTGKITESGDEIIIDDGLGFDNVENIDDNICGDDIIIETTLGVL